MYTPGAGGVLGNGKRTLRQRGKVDCGGDYGPVRGPAR